MKTATYEKSNVFWQLHQTWMRFEEWLEQQFSVPRGQVPDLVFPDWLPNLLAQLARIGFWLVVALLVILLGGMIWRIVQGYGGNGFWSGSFRPKSQAKVEQLTALQWWERSQQHARNREWGEACRCLYFGMLQQLHDRQIIPQQSSRTDGEYRQLTQTLSPAAAYEQLLATHEQVCFSQAMITHQDFEQCQQSFQQIETRLNTLSANNPSKPASP